MKRKLKEKNTVGTFFKKMFKKVFYFLFKVAIIAAIIFGIYTYFENQKEIEVQQYAEEFNQKYEEATRLTREETEALIKTLKQELINDISLQETGRPVKDGELFYVNDPQESKRAACQRIGGKRPIYCDSWGVMMFKITTVQHYSESLRGIELTELEALTLALDPVQAKELATQIIFEEVGGVWNWSVTHDEKKYFDKQVNTIRDLQAKLTK